MNYFELHVGDYDAATAHLSMLEDAAYGRMIRIYYRTEKPLPADIKAVCRLARAVSKPERDAVQAVLDEFFTLTDDGWRQARCDEEIERFVASEPERVARRSNEETRLKRHREERAELFRALNDAGRHAPWNTKMEALRAMVEALKPQTANEPATQPATAIEHPPATAPATPATATHGNVSPLPTSHSPPPKEEKYLPPTAGASAPTGPPPSDRDLVFANGVTLLTAAGVKEANARSFLAAQCKAHGDALVLDALNRCATESPVQPVPWLQARLSASPKKSGRHAGFDTKDYREGVTADGSL